MADLHVEATQLRWRARQETLDDGRLRVRVTGTFEQRGIAYRMSLVRAPFQPSNPHVLLLVFKGELIAGGVAQHVPVATVSFEQVSLRAYKLVSIVPGRIGISVENGRDT